MQDYLNKIVVMEHQFSYDKHVIAKVVKQTKATVRDRYLYRGWSVKEAITKPKRGQT